MLKGQTQKKTRTLPSPDTMPPYLLCGEPSSRGKIPTKSGKWVLGCRCKGLAIVNHNARVNSLLGGETKG